MLLLLLLLVSWFGDVTYCDTRPRLAETVLIRLKRHNFDVSVMGKARRTEREHHITHLIY